VVGEPPEVAQEVFISKHRRLSRQIGHGVQYLPGHVEPFVDLVISEYLPDDGEILDLGGGGLRFALPVALLGRRVTVVDVDPSGLDLEMVVQRVNENEGSQLDLELIAPMLEMVESDLLDFLRTNTKRFDFIAAFRVAHFMNPAQFAELFRLTSRALLPGHRFAFSAMTPHDHTLATEFNEVYRCTRPVCDDFPLFRSFMDDPEADRVRSAQNLGAEVHFVDSEWVERSARSVGFCVLVKESAATRIVEGFVVEKLET
jgi:SAM-dependent methyltransferase